MSDDRAPANRLAALATAVEAAWRPAAADLGASDAAALLAIAADGPLNVGAVAAAAGISPSAAVRLVDRLERAWLVERRRRTSRVVLVEATRRGRARAADLTATRIAAAEAFLACLDVGERRDLARLLARLTYAPPFDPARHCRFCDREACDCGRTRTDQEEGRT